MKLNLTETGKDFLLHCLEGGPSPVFNAIVLGNGADAGENAEALSNQLVSIGLTGIERNDTFVTLTGTLNNNSVSDRFRSNELGVTIEDPDNEGGSLLFAYGWVPDTEAILIPANTDYAFETIENVMVYVGTTENVSATLTESLVTVSKAEFNEHINNKDNPHDVTKSQVGLGNVENYSVNDQPPTYTVSSSLANLVSGEKMTTLLGKVAKAVQQLILHLSSKANPHGVSASQIGAAASTHYHSASHITSGTLSVSRGGTGRSSLTGTDYSTSRVRAISLQTSVPDSISNGHIVGVYSTS